MAKLKIDDKQLQRRLKRLGNVANDNQIAVALKAGALPIQAEAKRLAPKDTRTLTRSIFVSELYKLFGKRFVIIGTNVIYARIQEFGGVIKPRIAKMLSWVDRRTGERRFAKEVTIPAQPYLRPAFNRKWQESARKVADVLQIQIKRGL